MIPIEDLHKTFDLWIDKTSSPYFTSEEKDLFFNSAHIEFLNKHFNPLTSTHQLEKFSYDLDDVQELVPLPLKLVCDANGVVTRADLNKLLDTNRTYAYILNVARGKSKECGDNYKKVRWVKHNDYYSQIDNSFKKPEEDYPIYRQFKDTFVIEPKLETNVLFTVILEPLSVSLDDPNDTFDRGTNAVDSELSKTLLNEIVYLALKQAGISIREAEFYQMVERESKVNE